MPTTRPTSQPLYPNQTTDLPTMSFYPAPDPDGSCIMVCPGGGYGHLAMDLEGDPVARWLNTLGVSAMVLLYRHAGVGARHPAPLQDASRCIRTLRASAAERKLDPNRIGVMGFSAGGHLAATLSTHFDTGDATSSDLIERVSNRPDLSILCYPVITFVESCAHTGSRRNLLGENPPPDMLQDLSAERRVSPQTPPAFLFHTVDDPGVKVENSLLYAAALRDHRIPHEMHLYEHGPHGVGLAQNNPKPERNVPELKTWPALCANWIKKHNFGRGAN
jgi:acetyl esterase/lipase